MTFRLHANMSPDIAGVVAVLSETIEGVRSGDVPPAVANSVASLARALIASLESERVEVRLKSVEDLLGQLEQGRAVLAHDVGGSA